MDDETREERSIDISEKGGIVLYEPDSSIRTAKNRIILIDNYVDDSVLKMLTKRADNVSASIVTQHISDAFRLDIERHNRQYPAAEVRTSDRCLILDDTVYHLGASLKDLGKKLFAFCSSPIVIGSIGLGKRMLLPLE